MITPYQELYGAMQQELMRCQRTGGDKLLEIECCFQVASNFLNRLIPMAPISHKIAIGVVDTTDSTLGKDVSTGDTDVNPVITYYKEVQPAFLSTKRYYELCCYATMFSPTESFHDLKVFWIREANRAVRYFEDNRDLYDYFTRKRTDLDEDLFGRDPVDAERYGAILADFIALERYSDYLVQMIV